MTRHERSSPSKTVVGQPALLIAILVTVVAGLASCTDSSDDSAVTATERIAPTTSQDPTAPTETGSTDTSSGTASSPLADTSPCSLLSADAATSLGVGGQGGEERRIGSARRCRWRIEAASIADSFNLSLGIWDGLGVDDLPPDLDLTPLPAIGQHDAVQQQDVAGCSIILAITSSSRVDASANGGSVERACELAMQIATLIEPELP